MTKGKSLDFVSDLVIIMYDTVYTGLYVKEWRILMTNNMIDWDEMFLLFFCIGDY
jgi:hypothetical protein